MQIHDRHVPADHAIPVTPDRQDNTVCIVLQIMRVHNRYPLQLRKHLLVEVLVVSVQRRDIVHRGAESKPPADLTKACVIDVRDVVHGGLENIDDECLEIWDERKDDIEIRVADVFWDGRELERAQAGAMGVDERQDHPDVVMAMQEEGEVPDGRKVPPMEGR